MLFICWILIMYSIMNQLQEPWYVNQPCTLTIEISCMVHVDVTMILFFDMMWAKKENVSFSLSAW